MYARALLGAQHLTVLHYDPPLYIAAGPLPARADSSVTAHARQQDFRGRRDARIHLLKL